MCRLAMKTASKPFSPFSVLQAMESMQEGYDGSGLGLLLRGLEFSDYKYQAGDPILSGIAHTPAALSRLSEIMDSKGFELKYDHEFDVDRSRLEARDRHKYVLRVYKQPKEWDSLSQEETEHAMMMTRIGLRLDGADHGDDLTAFSLWPDVAMIKEVGWPLEIGQAFGLDNDRIKSRICFAQGRQNTNYGINLYACHPFFIEGVATMTNGENTAFGPIRDWLSGKGYPGYMGYQSDSEVFAHILHYVTKQLKLPLETYKHVITPLSNSELADHPQGDFLLGLRNVCRRLIIDGPNAVIGSLADETCLLAMDAKKLRPATVGGKPGEWAMASEMCGVDALIPDRDRSKDLQPMREHTIIIPPDRKELQIWSQYDQFTLNQAA
ncbi:MAG: glutamate synthase [Desulfobulbaceae bacterium]|nr:MAG: glutamate synthase [Desulfobulbaceae bacterium]